MGRWSDFQGQLNRLEELIRLALNKSSSIPASVAGTGFWKSLSGVLQPTASIGLPGQLPKTNSVASDIAWAAEMGPWATISGVFTPANDQTVLLVDTSGPQTTVNMPTAPYDGQNLIIYDYEGLAATNPIIIGLSGSDPATRIDDPSNPGTDPTTGGHIAQQGQTAWFKYFASAKQWQLVMVTNPYVATPKSWSQATWFIDSVAGLDTNPGTTSGSPLKTKSELARRYGGWSPTINATAVVVTYLNPDTTASDPALFAPNLINGGSFTQIASLPASSFTGTLNVVTAKNVAGNQALRSTFNTTTGAIAANMMLVNATRGNSRAFVQTNISGGTWQLSQPLQPYTSGAPTPTNVDTWQAGDAITGYVLMDVNIPKIDGLLSDYNGSFSNGHYIRQLNIWDPSGLGLNPVDINVGASPYIIECTSTRLATIRGYALATLALFMNFATNAFFFASPNDNNAIAVAGGFLTGAVFARGITFKNDVIFAATASTIEDCPLGEVYVDTSARLKFQGNCTLLNSSGKLFGPGTADVQFGCLLYTGQTAVGAMPIAHLNIVGLATAYSNVTTAGSTAVHNLALTAANLDAAAGATGFGGLAYSGAACITNGSQP